MGKQKLYDDLTEFPSIQFGVEMAFLSLESENPLELFPSEFTENNESIDINGLVWMGEPSYMKEQIEQKIAENFTCIKLKIGAIDFNKELELLQFIRTHFDAKTIEIRVDANGGFSPEEALSKLNQLHKFDLHSIEQPIRQHQIAEMKKLCQETPFPIALDEELIGVFSLEHKEELLHKIKPQYIILKPSLVGGFQGTHEWISLAEKHNIGWWITSALESNIGLNAIAQFTFTLQSHLPQGLGTGGLYTNNFDSPLEVKEGQLWYNSDLDWSINLPNFNF